MTMTEKILDFNRLEDGKVKLKADFKKKGKKYADIPFNGNLLNFLSLALDYISSSPSLKSKFADRLENFLKPRIQEIQSMIYRNMIDKEGFIIEFSKENIDDITGGLSFGSVLGRMSEYEDERLDLKDRFKNANLKKI
jgi:hypothetical protein